MSQRRNDQEDNVQCDLDVLRTQSRGSGAVNSICGERWAVGKKAGGSAS